MSNDRISFLCLKTHLNDRRYEFYQSLRPGDVISVQDVASIAKKCDTTLIVSILKCDDRITTFELTYVHRSDSYVLESWTYERDVHASCFHDVDLKEELVMRTEDTS